MSRKRPKEAWNWDPFLSTFAPHLECAEVCWGQGVWGSIKEGNLLEDFHSTPSCNPTKGICTISWTHKRRSFQLSLTRAGRDEIRLQRLQTCHLTQLYSACKCILSEILTTLHPNDRRQHWAGAEKHLSLKKGVLFRSHSCHCQATNICTLFWPCPISFNYCLALWEFNFSVLDLEKRWHIILTPVSFKTGGDRERIGGRARNQWGKEVSQRPLLVLRKRATVLPASCPGKVTGSNIAQPLPARPTLGNSFNISKPPFPHL